MTESWGTEILFFVIGAVCLGSVWLISHYCRKRCQKALQHRQCSITERRPAGDSTGVLGLLLHRYDYNELKLATNGFDPKHVLGKGGCGTVYKGQLSSRSTGGGGAVAIKRIYRASTRGRCEFLAEASVIGRMRHRNLVPLLGWSVASRELLLVYEFMPNGSLDKHLFGSAAADTPAAINKSTVGIDWQMRLNIIKGVASALAYLHEELEHRVVHRDVKASNVMLDADLNPRLGDFGLARLYEHQNRNPESTRVAGTLGYMPPECYMTGKVTEKIDVFGFGVLALEIACGRRPIMVSRPTREVALPDWVWNLHIKGRLLKAADPRLEQGAGFHAEEMERVLQVGLLCTHANPKKRPSMRDVGQILRLELPLPKLSPDRPMLFCPADSPIHLQSARATACMVDRSAPSDVYCDLA